MKNIKEMQEALQILASGGGLAIKRDDGFFWVDKKMLDTNSVLELDAYGWVYLDPDSRYLCTLTVPDLKKVYKDCLESV